MKHVANSVLSWTFGVAILFVIIWTPYMIFTYVPLFVMDGWKGVSAKLWPDTSGFRIYEIGYFEGASPFPVEVNEVCENTLVHEARYIPTRECRLWLQQVVKFYNEHQSEWKRRDEYRNCYEFVTAKGRENPANVC